MIKISVFITTFIFSTLTYAMSVDECVEQNKLYGDEKNHVNVSSECANKLKALATPEAVKTSLDLKTKVWGHKNLIIVSRTNDKDQVTTTYITGKYTKLENIQALAIDLENDEVAVLDSENGRVMYYSLTITGNVAPFRVLNSSN